MPFLFSHSQLPIRIMFPKFHGIIKWSPQQCKIWVLLYSVFWFLYSSKSALSFHDCYFKNFLNYMKNQNRLNSLSVMLLKVLMLMIWKHKDSKVCPIVTSLSLERIALSFSNWSLRASFCFGVSWGSFSFPCFLRFSSNSLRSCNSSNCSLYEYTLLSRFIFFTFSSLSLSFLHNATHSCYIQNKQ
jgi:hypothetical protein